MSNTKILNTDHKYLDLTGLQEFQGKVKTYVKESIDNVEIGGTNLILNSDFSEGTEHWSLWYRRGTLSVEDKIATFSLDDTYQTGMLLTSSISLESGQQYTVSFDIKSDSITSLNYCYLASSAGTGNIMLPSISGITSEWHRLECKFTATQIGEYMLGFGIHQAAGKSFQIKRVKVERGNKATDWSPAPEDLITYTDTKIDNLEIGGTNLALDSNVVVENNTYVMYKCNTSEDLETDREYTMTIWGTLGSDRDSFRLYDSSVSVALGTFTLVSLNRYVLTFKYKGNYPRLLHVLQFYSTGTSTSTIERIKIEKGNKATDWSPAPEDLITYTDTKIDNLEIGGTNLLRYIKDDGSSYWNNGSGNTCDITIDGDVIKGQTNGNNNPRIYNSSTKEIVWEPNTDYVLSYYAKGQGDYSALIIIEGNNVNFCPFSDMGVYSSEWKKYVKKFTTPSDIIDANTQLLKFYCGHRNTNDTTSWLEIKDIKLERGNKSTDWSPAPEDIQEKIDSKLGKTEKAVSASVADSAANADTSKALKTLSGIAQDLNNLSVDDYSAKYYGYLPGTSTNMPTHNAWQNSVMCFGLHYNGATAQMFFAKDKPLYYRSSQTGEWQQIAYKSDVDKAFNYLGYNLDLNNFYDNENKSGTVYINVDGGENLTNAPDKYGCAVNFGAGVSNFQLFSPAFSNKLYHRNRWWSDRGGEWKEWQQLATTDDVRAEIDKTFLGSNTGELPTSYIDITDYNKGAADYQSPKSGIYTVKRSGFSDLFVNFNNKAGSTSALEFKARYRPAADSGLYFRTHVDNNRVDGAWQKIAVMEDVQAVQAKIDGIEIGCTNLILNSDFSLGKDHWSVWSSGTLSVADKVATFSLSDTQTQGILQTSAFYIASGEEYVVSFDIRSDNISSLNYCYLMSSAGNISQPLTQIITTAWQRIEYKFKATVTGNYMFGFGMYQAAGKSFQIKRVKIEKGNKATDWSPAPEDIVNGIKIDTRNLIPNSESIYTNVHATSNSFSKQILLPIGTKVGDTFVFNCDGIVNNQGSATEYSLLLFDWASQRAASNYLTLTAENRMGTFTVTRDVAAGSLYIFLYAGKNNSTAGNAVTYTNCTLVKGTKPMLLWQPSVEEVQTKIDAKLSLSGGTLTGDLIAPSFKTNLTSGAAEAVMAYPINYAWGTDLNSDTYLKPGMYQMSSASSPANQPDGLTYGALVTMQGLNPDGAPTIGQIYFNQNTNGKAYIRTGTSSNILTRGWKQIAYKDDVDAKLGKTEKAASATSADSATTATNLASAPSLGISGNTITVTAGGKTSSAITVPYATKAGSATSATTATSATSATKATQDGSGNVITSTYATKAQLDGIKIDTRNLLTNSKEITIDASTLTSGTKSLQKKLPISVAVGDVLTFNCEDMIINAGTDQTHALLLYEPNVGALATVKYVSPSSKTAKIVVEKASSNTHLYLYAGFSNDSAGKKITYKGATLVKGDKPMLLWQAAPEDLPVKVGVINLISASDLELGAISDSTGTNSTTTSASRARTASYIPVTSSQLALKSWTNDVVFYLWSYDANKNPIQMSYSTTGWISSGKAYTLPEGTAYIRLVLKKNSGANFTTSELSTIKLKAEYSNKTTEWCPSVDDVQNQINALKAEIAALKAVINEITNANLS